MSAAAPTPPAESLFYRGSRLAAAGHHAEASAAYRASLSLAPSSHTCAENLGIALGAVGRRRESAAAFEHALRLRPERSESYSLLARTLSEDRGMSATARQLFSAALQIAPSRAELHYELARTDQLFGDDGSAVDAFATAQQIAYADWRRRMGCEASADGGWRGGPTSWHQVGGAVRSVRVLHEAAGAAYGRMAPRLHTRSSWSERAGLSWPPLRFRERSVVLALLEDVWISGNDGVITDDECGVYLPSHGAEIPLHLNLPHAPVAERMRDGSIRRVTDDEIVLSLAQLFAANFYSFLADALARLVFALDALGGLPPAEGQPDALLEGWASEGRRPRLRVLLAADGASLKPWMWTLLERLGIDRAQSYPYPVRAYGHAAELHKAAAARVRAARLLVVDWQLEEAEEAEDASCSAQHSAAEASALPPSAYAPLRLSPMAPERPWIANRRQTDCTSMAPRLAIWSQVRALARACGAAAAARSARAPGRSPRVERAAACRRLPSARVGQELPLPVASNPRCRRIATPLLRRGASYTFAGRSPQGRQRAGAADRPERGHRHRAGRWLRAAAALRRAANAARGRGGAAQPISCRRGRPRRRLGQPRLRGRAYARMRSNRACHSRPSPHS